MLAERAQQWALLICSKRQSTESRFFRASYLRFFWYENEGSSVLYSPWASVYLNSHWNNWITVSILQYRVTFWTPKIVPRLGKLRKSVGSFCIMCGLVHERFLRKPQKKHPKKVIFGYQNYQLSAWSLLYFLFKEDVWNVYDTFLRT